MTPQDEEVQANARLLTEYVSDAAGQRLYMEPWVDDQEFIRGGGRLLYSIDTDVITQFLDPHMSVPRKGKTPRSGYAQIFRDDPNYISVALGRAITTSIFFGTTDIQLIVLPPLEQEIQTIYLALLSKVHKQQKAVTQELSGKKLLGLELAIQTCRSDNEKLDVIIEHLPQVTEFIFGQRGPAAEIGRLNEILAKSNLSGLEQFIDKLPDGDRLKDILVCPKTIEDWIRFSKYKSEWHNAIRAQTRARPSWRLDTDISVLARIEILNAKLKQINCRIVHVTGDQAMHAAARQISRREGALVYSPGCLRHPRSFLAERGVLFADTHLQQRSESELLSWLDVFLADYTDDRGVTREKLEKLLATSAAELQKNAALVCQRDPAASASFAEKWLRFVEPVAVQHSDFSQAGEASHIRLLASSLLRNSDRLTESLEALVNHRISETWEKCFEAATATGLSLVRIELNTEEFPSRTVPPVTFDRFSATKAFVEALYRPTSAEGSPPVVDYRGMIEKIKYEDPTRYTYYLAFALLFGAVGKWYATNLLCERALSMAEREPENSIVSGREAYYLWSVATRLLAKSEEHFDEADALLNKAYSALQRDCANFSSLTVSTLRFDRERIAQALARHLFRRFVQRDEPGSIADLSNRIQELLLRVRDEKDRRVRESVERGALTNSLMCGLLLASDAGANDGVAVLSVYARDFDALKVNLVRPICAISYLHQAIFLAAQAFFEPPEGGAERHRRQRAAAKHFSDESIQAHSVAPYDQARFLFLRDICFCPIGGEARKR